MKSRRRIASPKARDKAPYQVDLAMSALGQRRTLALHKLMSALGQKALSYSNNVLGSGGGGRGGAKCIDMDRPVALVSPEVSLFGDAGMTTNGA